MIIRYTKKIDAKNRVVLPKELLKLANIKIGDDVYFSLTRAGNIIIKKYESRVQELGEEEDG